MKTPRVKDFDPEAKVPTLKSPLEGMPTIGKQPKVSPSDSPTPTREIPAEKTERQMSTDLASKRRPFVRRAFEWYEDQLAALKRLSLQEQMDGKDGSMSAMVREALDEYLKKRAVK